MGSVKTMSSWSRLVSSIDSIPEVFRGYINEEEFGSETFPYTIFIPPCRWGFNKVNPKLLYVLKNRLHILEKDKKTVKETCYTFENLNYVEFGTVLLYSWIEFNGEENGIPQVSRLEFNTVTLNIFSNLVGIIRSGINNYGQRDRDSELAKFNHLSRLNYKFMSYGRQGVMLGGKVTAMIYQPEILVEKARVLGRVFLKKAANPHLSILTDRELIIITDADRKYTKYGGVSTFIPLSRITRISYKTSDSGEFFNLCIDLEECAGIKLPLSSANLNEMDTFTQAANLQKQNI